MEEYQTNLFEQQSNYGCQSIRFANALGAHHIDDWLLAVSHNMAPELFEKLATNDIHHLDFFVFVELHAITLLRQETWPRH